ncbi:MAG: ATP-binding cassette, subfamily bacterial [Kribbellaceae bacterium]|nr:ATP-binding cassette, subfamily bacterial [Kribbellaceae bacterium]
MDRENLASLRVVLRATWHARGWRSLLLLVELTGRVLFPLSAVWTGLMVAGLATGRDGLLLAGAAALPLSQAGQMLALRYGQGVRLRTAEIVTLHQDLQLVQAVADHRDLALVESPDFRNKLELIEARQGMLGGALNMFLLTAGFALTALTSLVVLIWVHPLLAILPLAQLAGIPFARRASRLRRAADDASAGAARLARAYYQLSLNADSGMEARAGGTERWMTGQFVQNRTSADQVIESAERRAAALDLVRNLLPVVAYLACGLFLVARLDNGAVGLAEAAAALVAARQLQVSVSAPFNSGQRLGRVLDTTTRWRWCMAQLAAGEVLTGDRVPGPAIRTPIVASRLGFSYPEADRPAVADIDLRIAPGEIVAVVGDNGAGKTTLVKLLLGLYSPQQGKVEVGEAEPHRLDPGWAAAAFQDFVRPELTLQEAVGVGHLSHVEDGPAVMSALKGAAAEALPAELPNGLSTQLGARWVDGHDPSGGQWQQIAVARARMNTEARLLILDEPTASLDAQTEAELFGAYAREARRSGTPVVLVTHRFSSARMADRVLVVEAGRIVEEGSHDELMAAGGRYSDMVELAVSRYR